MVSSRRGTSDRSHELKRSQTPRRAGARRGEPSDHAVASGTSVEFADAERQVLGAFRKFLMAPGEMLCFANSDVVAMKEALRRLTDAGLLVAEKFPGAYSLTSAGFARMGATE